MRASDRRLLLMTGLLAGAALSACAGGGGGTTAMAPPVTPPPATPSPPAPTPLTLGGPEAYTLVVHASQSTVTANPSNSPVVTITDPDVTTPATPGQINFSGNETIVVALPGGQSMTTYTPADYSGVTTTAFGSRTLGASRWAYTGFRSGFSVDRLNAGLDANGALSNAAPAPKYAMVTESGNIQVLGVQTPAVSMPVSGTASYQGEAYGSDLGVFLARARINVDFAGLVSGRIDAPVYASGSGEDFKLDFTARMTGSSFTSTMVKTLNGVSAVDGTVSGAFFGPSSAPAAEVGGAFAFSNFSTGAFVAGAAAAPAQTAPIALQGPYAFFSASPASAAAAPSNGSGLTVTITDPDVAAPTGIEQIDFSGNETVRVQAAGYDHTFVPLEGQGAKLVLVASITLGENVSSWQSGANGLTIYRFTSVAPQGPSYAVVGEWSTLSSAASASAIFNAQTGGYFVMGKETGADLPAAGSATYTGGAVGRYLQTGAASVPFLARASITANFASTSGAVTGTILAPTYASDVVGPVFAVNFTADRTGSRFTSSSATATGDVSASGAVQGGFYGPAAAQAAGVFSFTGQGQGLVGGFVVGK